jgi:RHS repeat-associated protein
MTLISSANNELGILTAMKRLQYTEGGGDSKIISDGLDIVKETDGLGNTMAWYVRSLNIDEPLARIAADGTVRYYHADALGSIITLTDANGVVRTRYNYSPYGVTQVIGEASENPFQFTGRENDETGLYYYRARYYSPEIGRFISEDPRKAGDNYYVYGADNPTRFVDPLGLYGIDVHYYLTYELARKVGFSPGEAHLIASADQGFDSGVTSPWLRPDLHFASPEDAKKRLLEAMCHRDLKAVGGALHMLQDSYSHYDEGYRWWTGGHVVPTAIALALKYYFGAFSGDNDDYYSNSTRDTAMRNETSYYLYLFKTIYRRQ